MSESGEQPPQGQIIRRPNARKIDEANSASSSNKTDIKPAGFISNAIAAGWLGTALIGGAKGLDKHFNGDNSSASDHQSASTTIQVDKAHETQTSSLSYTKSEALPSSKESIQQPPLINEIFHDLNPQQQQEAMAWVEMFKARIAAKPGYEKEHRKIPQQYKDVIRNTANAYGVSEAMLYGIIAIENGGGTDIETPYSGAVGVAQLMPNTARQYGLIVNDKQDQRKDPVLSIDVAGRYLRDN